MQFLKDTTDIPDVNLNGTLKAILLTHHTGQLQFLATCHCTV